MILEKNLEVPELELSIGESLAKMRKICKIFRKSPVKNAILQKYVVEKEGKELALLLDCPTRWCSLDPFIARFQQVAEPIKKTLADLEMSSSWDQSCLEKMPELMNAFVPAFDSFIIIQ